MLGSFRVSNTRVESISREQVETEVPNCSFLLSVFFRIPAVAGKSKKVKFYAKIKSKDDSGPIILTNNSAVDRWAESLTTEVVLNNVEYFEIGWSYKVKIFDGLPTLGRAPGMFPSGFEYRSSDTMQDLYKRIFASQADTILPQKMWFAMFDKSDPTIVAPLCLEKMQYMPDLVCVEKEGYSHVDMSMVRPLVQFGGHFCATAEQTFTEACRDTTLSEHTELFLQTITMEDNTRLESLVKLAVQHLNVLTHSFHLQTCCNEATRRQIVDVFACYASAYVKVPCKVKSMTALEELEHDAYIGDGLFDYYFEDQVRVITLTAVHDSVELKALDELFPAVEEQKEHKKLIMEAVTEGHNELIMKYFAQLLAQMLDQYKSDCIQHHRSEKGLKSAAADRPLCSIRGILTTGQKTLFFGLQDTPGRPILKYFGTHSLHILPQQMCRGSGLSDYVDSAGGLFAPLAGVDEAAVKSLLVAFIVFFTCGF